MTPEEPNQLATARQRSWQSWLIALLTGAIGAFALYAWKPGLFQSVRYDAGKQTQKAEPQKEEYYCPMHKDYKSGKPGSCPICSMKLVKLDKPATNTAAASAGKTDASMPGMKMGAGQSGSGTTENAIFVPPEKQQMIGMRSVVVVAKPLVKDIRIVGK